KKIRENLKLTETPVIIFSILSDEKDIAQAKELGANHFMIKSIFTLDEIVSKVRELTD
ncbi:MAG: Response regulatory protein, partial [Patescibacteria group bacterium]|nr:Response regulatory protein [Patescibacteria group bacterium]